MSIQLPKNQTKIICTIGPSCSDAKVLTRMVAAGMNICRLNFSHGSFAAHRKVIRTIRRVAKSLDRPLPMIADLPGPKIRLGKLAQEPILLEKGSAVTMVADGDFLGDVKRLPVQYDAFAASVKVGGLVFINDGFIQLQVEKIRGQEVDCRVIIGGRIRSYKGVNLPGAKLALSAVSQHEFDIIDFCLEEGVDMFCVSFVEDAADIDKVRKYVAKKGKGCFIIAKFERQGAIENSDAILRASDGLMVARGDLGVEIPLEEVPIVQKRLIREANMLCKPVITATQMLESMIDNIRPTRAEVADVANAILDGTDAIMLSGETAVGNYPAEAVETMAKVAAAVEPRRRELGVADTAKNLWKHFHNRSNTSVRGTISIHVIETLETMDIKLILTPTASGGTARRVSRFKPECWTIAFTPNKPVRDYLVLSAGVWPIYMKERGSNRARQIIPFIRKAGLAKKGDNLIITQGVPLEAPTGTNSIEIVTLA